MRNIQKLIAFVFVLVIWSCTKDDAFIDSINDGNQNVLAKNNSGNSTQGNTPNNMPVYYQNELIIQYKPATPESMKQTIRTTHGINATNAIPQQGFGIYEVCRCNNPDIEKWIFPNGTISIEPKKQVISGTIGGESFGILDVDFNFVASFDMDNPILGTTADTFYESYIKDGNSGVTIAILDTGIATGLTVFNTDTAADQFLYDATLTAYGEEKSGWDFVNNDSNVFDDDPSMHGSIIADQINKALDELNIPHQILPIKIADADGSIDYFHMVCALMYAFERSEVVNASFGWYGDPFGDFGNTIFKNILEMFPDVILVASAGNTSKNNDIIAHYPSSYALPNVISVGSCNQAYGHVSNFSNYGASVDFYAKGEGIPFFDSFVKGTSFAAPQIAIEVVKIIHSGEISELSMAERVETLGISTTDTFLTVAHPITGELLIKNTFYNKYIISDD